jgi:ribose transport system ATP-binding protein
VLRDGRVAGTLEAGEINHDALVNLIMGRQVKALLERHHHRPGAGLRLECRDVAGGPVRKASFGIRTGEIVGIAGLLGSGRSSLLRLIAGDVPREAGNVLVDGTDSSFSGPGDAARGGVAYAPEDRLTAAAFLDLSVRENIGITAARRYFRRGLLRHRTERMEARELLQAYQVKAASTEAPLSTLSGGNQQKALLVRWLRLNPRLLLLDEPTQGVDVGARAEIWQLVRQAVDQGAAALVVLSDFDELVSTCDRAIVLSRGSTVLERACEGLSESDLEHSVLSADGMARA